MAPPLDPSKQNDLVYRGPFPPPLPKPIPNYDPRNAPSMVPLSTASPVASQPSTSPVQQQQVSVPSQSQDTPQPSQDSSSKKGFFSKLGTFLKQNSGAIGDIGNQLAAAGGNLRPLQLAHQARADATQQKLADSTLQNQALDRTAHQQQIDNFQTPQAKADMEVATAGRLNALKPPASEINQGPNGELNRDEFNPTTHEWTPQTHQVPNPALAPYSEPVTSPKPNYVTDWNAGPPPGMPKTVAEPVHPLPPAPMMGVTYGPAVQDPTSGAFTQDVRNKRGQSLGPIPVGGIPTAALPTTSTNSTNQIEKDVNGNFVYVPKKTVQTRTRGGHTNPLPTVPGAGGGAAPPQATAINGPDGSPLHAPLGADAKKTLRQVSTSGQMLDSVMPDLTQAVNDIGHGSNIYDAAKTRDSWLEYNKGLDPNNIDPNSVVSALPGTDPRITKMFPALAMMKVVLAQPFMNSSRNFQFMQQIQQHLPDPEKDTPQLMLSKAQWIQKSLPMLKKAVYESEGVQQKPDAAGPPAAAKWNPKTARFE